MEWGYIVNIYYTVSDDLDSLVAYKNCQGSRFERVNMKDVDLMNIISSQPTEDNKEDLYEQW